MNQPMSRTLVLGVGLPFILGVATVLVSYWRGIPGDGTFIAAAVLLGLMAGLATGGRPVGLAAALSGLLVVLGSGGSLSWLVIIILAALMAHGFGIAWVVLRARRLRLGWHLLRDARLVVVVVVILALPVLYVLVANDFARSPP